MEERQKKRLIIILFYLVTISLLVFAAYYFFFRNKETCFDKIKNQNEQKTDCGGVCQKCPAEITALDLLVGENGYITSGNVGQFDFWGEIINPNNFYGAKKFDYEVIFENQQGEIVAKRSGQNFVLPGEKKQLVITNIFADNPFKVVFLVSNPEWVEFTDYYERPQLKIVNKNYSEIISGTGFSEVRGLLKNESPFDFNTVRIGIILRDGQSKVLAVNSTEMRTVRSKEEREFFSMWPAEFSGSVEKVEAFAEVDVFDSEAFFKRNFEDQKL